MDCEKLIFLVQNRSAIYDSCDKIHRNKDEIDKLWGEIAKEMNETGEYLNCLFWYIMIF